MKNDPHTPKRHFHAEFPILLAAVCFLVLFAVTEAQNLLLDGGIRHSSVYRAVLLVVICGLFYLGTILRVQRTGNRHDLQRLMLLFFILYIYLLVNLTLLDRSLGRGEHSLRFTNPANRADYLEHFVNLRPFQSIWEVYIQGFLHGYVHSYYMLLNLLGNICAFMPFAFFLPFFFTAQKNWYVFLPTMLAAVFFIEALQLLFMVGSCDVDDLILNVSGAFLMYRILRIPTMQNLVDQLTGR